MCGINMFQTASIHTDFGFINSFSVGSAQLDTFQYFKRYNIPEHRNSTKNFSNSSSNRGFL